MQMASKTSLIINHSTRSAKLNFYHSFSSKVSMVAMLVVGALVCSSRVSCRRLTVGRAIWRTKSTQTASNSCSSSIRTSSYPSRHLSRAWQASSLSSPASQASQRRQTSTRHPVPITSKSACSSPSPPKCLSSISASCSTLTTFPSRRSKNYLATRQALRCKVAEPRPSKMWIILDQIVTQMRYRAVSRMRRLRCDLWKRERSTRTGRFVLAPTKRSITCSIMTMRDLKSQNRS